MGGDAVEQLERTDAQRGADPGLETVEGLVTARREEPVEAALPTDRPVDEVGDERAVACVEARAAQLRREEHVRVRAVLDADQCVDRDAASVPHGPSRGRSPRQPASHADAAIAGLPSGCTSRRRRHPPPVATHPSVST